VTKSAGEKEKRRTGEMGKRGKGDVRRERNQVLPVGKGKGG
jgi:hypothetical protein